MVAYMHKIIVVTCEEDLQVGGVEAHEHVSCEIVKEQEIYSTKILKNDLVQLQRLMEQRHLSERDSKLMIGAQMNMDKKVTDHLKVRHQRALLLVFFIL